MPCARLTTGPDHANPHGTVHGAVFYAVAGAAVAAAANDEEHSGIISSVLVEYLQPAAIGDELYAEVEPRAVDRPRGPLHRHGPPRALGDLLAWVRARGHAALPLLTGGDCTRCVPMAGHHPPSAGPPAWPNLWESCH